MKNFLGQPLRKRNLLLDIHHYVLISFFYSAQWKKADRLPKFGQILDQWNTKDKKKNDKIYVPAIGTLVRALKKND